MPRLLSWTPEGRLLVFMLSATSIWCLLAEFYGVCSMRGFTLAILLPATTLLVLIAIRDRLKGDGRVWSGVVSGTAAGLAAGIAYDLFRLPFVFSHAWSLDGLVPQMNLFKVFPRFGAMILGEALEQPAYSTAAQLIGWAYHFSNAASFGIMYTAAVGDPRRRSWLWAVPIALGLELAMLITPYPRFFGIPLTPLFVAVTLTAHLLFGVTLGIWAKRQAAVQWRAA